MRHLRLVATAMVLAITGPAVAQQAASTTTTTVTNSVNAGDQVVCRSSAPTGTRFTKKTCLTRRTWDEMAAKARLEASRLLNGPNPNLEKGE